MQHAPASSPDAPAVSLVFPCYRAAPVVAESLRAVGRVFARTPGGFEAIAVDDGSDDGTWPRLERLAAEHPWLRVRRHPRNRGKGAAVMTALAAARGRFVIVNDIDLQYGVAEMLRCRDLLLSGTADLAIGSRVHPDSVYLIRAEDIRYIFTRHLASRALNALLRATLLPGIHDSQCGLKGFSRPFIDDLLATGLAVNGFSYDVELLALARARRFAIREMPVRFRYSDIPSTVGFLRAAARMAADIARIALRKRRGGYDPPEPR